jgi:hypothetical protein
MAGKLSRIRKQPMKLKYIFMAFLLTAAIACNNEASTQDEADSVIHTQDSNQSNWPEPGDVVGGDTIPAPEQSKSPTLQNK